MKGEELELHRMPEMTINNLWADPRNRDQTDRTPLIENIKSNHSQVAR